MNQKVALVTGASSGIGTAIVLSLAKDGYFVMAAGRDTTRTEQIRSQCTNVESMDWRHHVRKILCQFDFGVP